MGRIAKNIYAALGSKIKGDFPDDVQKMVIIAAPHTSWHDFYMGLLFRDVVGVKINFLGKKELFKWPFGWFFKKLGGAPLGRNKEQNQVKQIAKLFNEHEVFRLALSPEGTRKKVEIWKTGFYYIALKAEVPVLPITMNFKDKDHCIGELFYPTGDITRDMIKLRSFFDGVQGRVSKLS